MCKINAENDLTNDSDTVEMVKKQISKWAKSIPHHNYKNLGDLVEIVEVVERPVYTFGLHSQLDTRTVREGEKPFTGQDIPEKIYHHPSEVEVWDQDLHLPADFKEENNSYIVEGSQEVITCSRCKGRGRTICDTCSGKGSHECGSCSGSGETTCQACHGTGKQQEKCGTCGGSGQVKSDYNNAEQRWNYIQCSSCSGGSHTVNCSRCHGTKKETCSTCSGSGTVRCETCKGTGEITCPKCEGSGKTIKYFIIDQELIPRLDTASIEHELVAKRYPKFGIDSNSSYGISVGTFEVTDGSADFLSENETMIPQFEDLRSYSVAQTSEITHIVRQTVSVREVPLIEVKYSFEERGYRLLIFNRGAKLGKKNEFYSTDSPMSRIAGGHYKEARKFFEEGNYVDCYKIAYKAMQMNPGNTKAQKLIDESEEKLRKPGIWASWLTFFPMCYVYWIVAHKYLSEPKFFFDFANNWYNGIEWMSGIHPTVAAITAILALLLFGIAINIYLGIIRIRWVALRFIFSIITMIITAGIIAGFVILLDKCGVILLFAFAGHFLQAIFNFIIGLF